MIANRASPGSWLAGRIVSSQNGSLELRVRDGAPPISVSAGEAGIECVIFNRADILSGAAVQ